MKLRSLLLAASAILFAGVGVASIPLGGSIFPLTLISQPPINLTDAFNEMEILINQQVVGLSTLYAGAMTEPTAGVDTSGTAFSTNLQGNPLVLQTDNAAFVSTGAGFFNSAALYPILASQSGRTIYPGGGLTIMVSGTPGTATAVALECGDGTLIASWPIADLPSLVPVGIYGSSAGGATTGAGLGRGCPASKGVYLSNVGTNLTTTTYVYVNLPYTVQ